MKIETEDFGRLIHTALRKACDSLATSYMYNLIRALPDEAWVDFSNTVRDAVLAMRPKPKNMDDLVKRMKSVWAGMSLDTMYSAEKTHSGWFASFYVLARAAEDFDDNDWRGVCAFLVADRK